MTKRSQTGKRIFMAGVQIAILGIGVGAYQQARHHALEFLRTWNEIHEEARSGPTFRGQSAPAVHFQRTSYDCGGAVMKMIFDHWDIPMAYEDISAQLQTTTQGTSMFQMRNLARQHGLISEGWMLTPNRMLSIELPAVVLLHKHHYALLATISAQRQILLLDPARGSQWLSMAEFQRIWAGETLLFHKLGDTLSRETEVSQKTLMR